MTRNTTHNFVKKFHKELADAHVDINGFYRFDVSEVESKLRSGIGTPALLIEAHSAEPSTNGVSNFNRRAISFLIMDKAGSETDYDKRDDVLDTTENIVLDIKAKLQEFNSTKGHWLFGKFDANTFKYEKAGPLFNNMFGWNVLYELKMHEPGDVDPAKWNFPATP